MATPSVLRIPTSSSGGWQRASLMALLTIALLTGFTAHAIFFAPSYPAGPTSGNANPAIGEAFYASLNEALAGGGIEPLAALLAGIFRDHDADTGATRTAAEFLDHVRAMGAAPQGIRLEPISMEASGDSLIVNIDLSRAERPVVAELTVETSLPSPYSETLRIVHGKIVDRWAPAIPWLEVANAGTAAIPLPALTKVKASLMRLTVSGGMAFEWDTTSSGFLTIESGAGRWTASAMSSGDAATRLQQGDFVTFSNGMQVGLRAVDGPVTALLFLTAAAPAPNGLYQRVTLTETAQGVSRSILWTGPIAESDAITRYRPARIVLPAKATLELRHAQGIDALLSIDGGVLELWSPDGTISLLSSNYWLQEHAGAAQLDAGHAGAVVAPETVTVRNPSDQPIALFVIAFERATVAR